MGEALARRAEEVDSLKQILAKEAEEAAAVEAAARWRTVDPFEAKKMIDIEGYSYVDIR